MAIVKIREKSQITIPSSIRKELGIKEGDYLEVTREGDRILLIPKIVIDKNSIQLSKKGEKYLQEALDDVKEGRVKESNNVEELFDDLRS
jgi:AbrB family looped-hinge helix DNA binding protein